MPNIEIKAKVACIETLKEIALSLGAKDEGTLNQKDTYFYTKKGRLKLREINNSEAQLIPYFKDYSHGPMKSSYAVLPSDKPQELIQILDHLYGVEFVVEKRRDLFMLDNVRIHFDQVTNLGEFLEFEAVYNNESEKVGEVKKVEELLEKFHVKEEDLLNRSYIDYMQRNILVKNLKTIFLYENDTHAIVELKRTDLDSSEPPQKRLFILLWNKKTDELTHCHFVDWIKNDGEDKRIFQEGELLSNSESATWSDGGQSISLGVSINAETLNTLKLKLAEMLLI